MIHSNRGMRGFTIVELLIVVVVIAILAAITIVSYNGITSRAQLTRTIDSVKSGHTVLEMYYATNSRYPVDYLGQVMAPYICLGTGYTGGKCGYISLNGTCDPALQDMVDSWPNTTESPSVNNDFYTLLQSRLPAISIQDFVIEYSVDQTCDIIQHNTGATYLALCSVTVDSSGTLVSYDGVFNPTLEPTHGNCDGAGAQAYILTYFVKNDDCGLSDVVKTYDPETNGSGCIIMGGKILTI